MTANTRIYIGLVYHTWTSSFITWSSCRVTAVTSISTIFGRCSYSPLSFLQSTSTRLRTFWPLSPSRPLTIHWKNEWKFLYINCQLSTFLYKKIPYHSVNTRIYIGLVYHTWTCSLTTWVYFLVTANTFIATIFGSCGYSPNSFLWSNSTRLRTFWPLTPSRPLTMHWNNGWGINL